MSSKKKIKQAIKVLEERVDLGGRRIIKKQKGSGPKAKKFWRKLGKAVKKGAKKLGKAVIKNKLISKGLAAAADVAPDPRLKLALGVSAKAAKALGAGKHGMHGGAMVTGQMYPTQVRQGSGLRRAGGSYHGKGLKRAGGALRPAGSRPRRGGAAKNPWLAHVARYRAKHPGMSYKECLKAAKKTYKK
jgi:hypothetical protein